jgi:hypothetical protein
MVAVGGVYISIDSTNPSTSLGYGTWIRFANGKCLIGVDESNSPTESSQLSLGSSTVIPTGSVSSQTFSGNAITSVINHTHNVSITDSGHTHIQNSHTHIQDSHNHLQNSHNHTQNSFAPRIINSGTQGTVGVQGASAASNASASNSATTATNQAATAVNQVATAVNQVATAVNQSATTGVSATTANPASGVTSITPTGTISQATVSINEHSLIQPSITVYFWLRTA